MKTIDEAWDIIESINADAYNETLHLWIEADRVEDEGEGGEAEDMRCDAAEEQAECFRDGYDDLSDEDKNVIKHWMQHDEDFRDQFLTYYGDYGGIYE